MVRKLPIALMGALLAVSVLCGCASANQQAASASASAPQFGSTASTDVSPSTALVSSASSSAEAAAQSDAAASASPNAGAFPSWSAESASLKALTDFVEAAVDESSPYYIAVDDRVATLDMDGTFLCEKAPVYLDYCLMFHRLLDDPDYVADPETLEGCKETRDHADLGQVKSPEGFDKDAELARAFADMTPEEFRAYVREFADSEWVEGFSGMTYGQSFYLPMLEVIDYLERNGFSVYVVSACEREVVRGLVCDRLGIAPDHVIGSDWGVEATSQNGADANGYTYEQDDELTLDGTYLGETSQMNKVIAIQREIGKQPVLAFGNSTGDFSMLNYAMQNDEYKAQSFLVIADDLDREYGDLDKAREMTDEAQRSRWTIISMRDDWVTIYGDGVSKTLLPGDDS